MYCICTLFRTVLGTQYLKKSIYLLLKYVGLLKENTVLFKLLLLHVSEVIIFFFLRRNYLEWDKSSSAVSAHWRVRYLQVVWGIKRGFLSFPRNPVCKAQQSYFFFHLEHEHWHRNSRHTTLSCHFSEMHEY